MLPTGRPGLVRAIGRWSLAALVLNSIFGSALFGLPSTIAQLVGRHSPWAVFIAGAISAVVIGCYAEVASQFTQTGGPYAYARAAFGRLVGIETGWMLWLARLTGPAANANLFVVYLGEFWPQANEPVPRFAILTVLVGFLALINVRGVRAGTYVSNIFTVAKLLPLILIAVVGAFYLLGGHTVPQPLFREAGSGSWLKAILLLVFAYGGFENALTPMGEAKDPRRDVAFGLFVAVVTCIVLYTTIQWVVVGVLPDPAHSERPLAEVARLILGNAGAAFISIGALISIYGYLGANILAVPRITFALAEAGDFPSIFSAIHSKFRTPYFSILVFAVLTWLFALLGNFSWNLTLSAVARLFYYAAGCAALPMLRRKQPGAAFFRLPGGNLFALLGVAACLVLATQVDLSGFLILLTTIVVAFANWLLVRRRAAEGSPS